MSDFFLALLACGRIIQVRAEDQLCPAAPGVGQLRQHLCCFWVESGCAGGLLQHAFEYDATPIGSRGPLAGLARCGPSDGLQDLLYLKVSSGIGAALILAGRVHHGFHGLAG